MAGAGEADCGRGKNGSFVGEGDEKSERNRGADTQTRSRPVPSNGRNRFGEEAGNIMGSGSGEGIRFPSGREFRYDKAGNAWAVILG